jgi:hypothetical protein
LTLTPIHEYSPCRRICLSINVGREPGVRVRDRVRVKVKVKVRVRVRVRVE